MLTGWQTASPFSEQPGNKLQPNRNQVHGVGVNAGKTYHEMVEGVSLLEESPSLNTAQQDCVFALLATHTHITRTGWR